jgi:hypothetical protein
MPSCTSPASSRRTTSNLDLHRNPPAVKKRPYPASFAAPTKATRKAELPDTRLASYTVPWIPHGFSYNYSVKSLDTKQDAAVITISLLRPRVARQTNELGPLRGDIEPRTYHRSWDLIWGNPPSTNETLEPSGWASNHLRDWYTVGGSSVSWRERLAAASGVSPASYWLEPALVPQDRNILTLKSQSRTPSSAAQLGSRIEQDQGSCGY